MDIFRLGRMLMDVDGALYQQANTPRQDKSTNRCYSEEQVFIQQGCVCAERPAGHTHTQLPTLSSSPTAPHWPPASLRIWLHVQMACHCPVCRSALTSWPTSSLRPSTDCCLQFAYQGNRSVFQDRTRRHPPDLATDNLRKLFHHQTEFL